MKWFQGTADAVRQFLWVFEVGVELFIPAITEGHLHFKEKLNFTSLKVILFLQYNQTIHIVIFPQTTAYRNLPHFIRFNC